MDTACATMKVKQGKVEKVINVSDYDPSVHTKVEVPEVEIAEFDPTTIPMTSGQHAEVAKAAYLAGLRDGQASAVPTVSSEPIGDEDESDILQSVVDDTNRPKGLAAVPPVEDVKAAAQSASDAVKADIAQKEAASKGAKK